MNTVKKFVEMIKNLDSKKYRILVDGNGCSWDERYLYVAVIDAYDEVEYKELLLDNITEVEINRDADSFNVCFYNPYNSTDSGWWDVRVTRNVALSELGF